jgi:putative colanic acid biosynthesis acetyltransferase WcaF
MNTDLSSFNIGDFKAGPAWKIMLWYGFNYIFFYSAIPWPYRMKRKILLMFGAKVGLGLVIKPKVRIKYPWKLSIGNYCWIGEDVWIDNLENVEMRDNVCISQGAMLLTGNHDYSISRFPYRLGQIVIEDGVWIGAKSVVCPGVICKSHSILTVNSVATKQMEELKIYAGNPAVFTRNRKILK